MSEITSSLSSACRFNSSGPLAAAVRAAGEETIKQAVFTSLVPFKTPGGGYRQENLIHYVIATA